MILKNWACENLAKSVHQWVEKFSRPGVVSFQSLEYSLSNTAFFKSSSKFQSLNLPKETVILQRHPLKNTHFPFILKEFYKQIPSSASAYHHPPTYLPTYLLGWPTLAFAQQIRGLQCSHVPGLMFREIVESSCLGGCVVVVNWMALFVH